MPRGRGRSLARARSSSTSAAARPSSSLRTSHTSLDVGCVRLTERFGEDADAPAPRRTAPPALAASTRAIGVAGTVTSLAALDLGLVDYDPERVHGHVLTPAARGEQLGGWPRSRSRSGAACPGSSPSALR